MRKLKALFVLLFAVCLSFTLFACGGGDDSDDNDNDNPSDGGGDTAAINSVTVDDLSFTDSQSADDVTAALNDATVKVRHTGSSATTTLKGSDCTITHNIQAGVIGSNYEVTFTPKENNPNNRSATASAVVDHTWVQDTGSTTSWTCSHDQAVKTETDEDVAIHYGDFHAGTASTDTAHIAKTLLGEEDAAELGLHAENTANTTVFSAAAGINEGVTSSGRIKAFGNDESYYDGVGTTYGAAVPTVTAGQLEPGMSISISGYARTDYATWDIATDAAYYLPSFGIADRYNKLSTWNTASYQGGASVIVRSEGWVLYNGIGGAPRTLAGLPAFVGNSNVTSSGEGDKANYGSHDEAKTEQWPNGYDATTMPEFTSSDWHDWWVYSRGDISYDADYYDYTPITVTWTYHTYGTVGIIEITREMEDLSCTLVSYIKVPNATRGYYDTIIHGDYSSLLITKSSVIETETTTGIQVDGLKAGAQAKYLAGQQIDAANTVAVKIVTKQAPNDPRDFVINNDMLYYYTGDTQTVAAATTDLADDAKWEQVGSKALTTAMQIFKVKMERSGQTFNGLIVDANGESPISVITNNVTKAYGSDYDALANNRKTGEYALGVTADGKASLTLESGAAQVLPEGQEIFTGTDANYRYIAVRLEGLAAAGWTSPLAAATTAQDVKVVAKADGDDVLVAFALKKAALGTDITVTGIQATDLVFKFGTGIIGFDVTSSLQAASTLTFNGGGEVTITYTSDAIAQISLYGYSAAAQTERTNDLGGLTWPSAEGEQFVGSNEDVLIMNFSQASGKTSITLKFLKFPVGATEMPRIEALDANNNVVAVDYIDFSMSIDSEVGDVQDGYMFSVENGILSIVKVFAATNGKVNVANVLGSLTVTANQGDLETAKQLNLSFSSSHGLIVFNDATLATLTTGEEGSEKNIYTISSYIIGSAEGEDGMVVTITVDLEGALVGFTGAYGIEINPSSDSTNYWWYDGSKLTKTAIGNAEDTLVQAGDCFTPGVNAKAIKDGDAVKYYAAYREVGGNHIDDGHGKCALCGMAINELAVDAAGSANWKWSNNTLYMNNMQVGDVYDFQGTFVDSPIYLYGNVGIVAAFRADTHLYWMRSDGWMKRSVGDVWDNEQLPVSSDETYMSENEGKTNDDLWTDLPYNTLNGVATNDGEKLDTLTATNFQNWVSGKKLRILARVLQDTEKGTYVDVEWRFMLSNGSLVLSYHQGFKVTDLSTLSVGINYDTNVNMTEAHYVKSTVNKSVISSVEGVELNDVANLATFETDGFDANGNAVITTGGMASKNGTQFYVNFKVNFSMALPETTAVEVKDVAGATAVLGAARTDLTVYLPLTKGSVPESVIIALSNKEAATLQANIKLDLTGLGVSDVEATVTGDTALTLAKGTFTIAYTSVEATDKVAVGEHEYALSALKTTEAEASDLGNGLKVYAASGVANGAITLTFVKDAADITKEIPGYTILLKRGTGTLISNVIAPALTVGTFGQEINDGSGWYAKADGKTLYLLSNGTNPSSLPVNINAGKTTDLDMLGTSELAFTVDAEKNIRIKEYSVLYPYVKGSFSGATDGAHLIVLTIDLTALGIGTDTQYGIAIADADNVSKYYPVAADRTIGAQATLNETQLTLRAGTCTETGIKAYGNAATADDSVFYGNITFELGHHTFDANGKCTTCNNVSGWFVDNVKVGKIDNSVGFPGNAMTGGENKAYNPLEGEKNSSIVQGQKITAKGVVSSSGAFSYNGIAILFYPGVSFSAYNAMHIRGDAWINGLGNRTGGTDTTSHLTYAIDAKVNGEAYTDAAYIEIAKLAEATIVWDWTDASKVVITYTLDGIETEGNYVLTVTITPEGTSWAATRYSIGIAPDSGSFTGTIECVCAKDFENPNPVKAEETHTHGNWNEQDRCPVDGELNPEHVHSFESGVCKCGAKEITVTADTKTYKGAAEYINGYKSNDTSWNWWDGSTDDIKVSGDFALIFEWDNINDKGFALDAVFELNEDKAEEPGYLDVDVMNTNTCNVWGALIKEYVAPAGDAPNGFIGAFLSGKNATQAVDGTNTLTADAWEGHYVCTVTRTGTTITVTTVFKAAKAEVTVTNTITLTGMLTDAVVCRIAGNPAPLSNFQAWSGTLTAQE